MVKSSLLKVVTVAAASLLLLSGCARTPDATATADVAVTPEVTETPTSAVPEPEADFKTCVVWEADDGGFGAAAVAGLQRVETELDVAVDDAEAPSTAEFAAALQEMIDARCGLVAATGLELGTATEAAARQNTDVDFLTVDYAPREETENVKPVLFNTAQSAFLAGYLAAAMSESGEVGTFGAGRLPAVTIFMDGFSQGVAHHNRSKGTSVSVIGWDHQTQRGDFLQSDSPYQDVAGAKALAQTQIEQGADIIMPVAGAAGVGVLEAAQEADGVSVIWTDSDGCETNADSCPVILTSVVKGVDQALIDATRESEAGEFTPEKWVGTLANGGTSLAPFHDFDAQIPDDTKSELDKLQQDIIDGRITVNSAAQPR